ncbi:hypothetical protein GQ42DRAFT_31100 [Ramicandelaber brevisporus]|nr:hypothetical protein GQ42DRAFT_31100 [Ramicandelaber brevisporus]
MQVTRLLLLLAVLLVGTFSSFGRADADSDASEPDSKALYFPQQLTDANYQALLPTKSQWMLMFASAGCSHCRKFKPKWAKFISHIQADEEFALTRSDLRHYNIGMSYVDVAQNPTLTSLFEIKSIPQVYHVSLSSASAETAAVETSGGNDNEKADDEKSKLWIPFGPEWTIREYKDARSSAALMSFIKTDKWKQVSPMTAPSWRLIRQYNAKDFGGGFVGYVQMAAAIFTEVFGGISPVITIPLFCFTIIAIFWILSMPATGDEAIAEAKIRQLRQQRLNNAKPQFVKEHQQAKLKEFAKQRKDD